MRDRVLSSRVVFDGQIITVRVDEVEAADGHVSTREVVDHRGAVGVVCVHNDELVLVRQYRHATGTELLEIPAGKLDPGESPEATARRELVEEVGLRPNAIEHLATYYTTPGFTNEKFHLYLVTDASDAQAGTDPGEVVEVVRRPLSSLRDLISSGEIEDAKSLLGLALLALRS